MLISDLIIITFLGQRIKMQISLKYNTENYVFLTRLS